MESCTSGMSCTSWILNQRATNSCIWTDVVIRILRELIQLPFCSFWQTVLFFWLASSKRWGARYLGASPSSQLWCQKHALLPFPIVVVIEALKSKWSRSLCGSVILTQGFESWTHSCHNQRRHKVLPNFSKFGTPNPPKPFGMQTVGQFTKQCPPLAFSSPFHRNDLLILSICFLAHTARGNMVRW
jgi:hypothetical protein